MEKDATRIEDLAEACGLLERELAHRRAVEQRTRAVIGHFVVVQEDERRWLASELHGRLGQSLTALRMHLEVLEASCAPDGDAARQLARAQALAAEIDACVDTLAWSLQPAALEQVGLAPALDTLVRGWSRRRGVPAEFYGVAVEGLRLSPHVEINLFRIAQEALINVHRHARATRVGVFLERLGRRLVLIVEDDGRGFDITCVAADTQSGMGLAAMRQRAALLDGEIEVESSPGSGTMVHVRVAV